jgi:hypothetical protein
LSIGQRVENQLANESGGIVGDGFVSSRTHGKDTLIKTPININNM